MPCSPFKAGQDRAGVQTALLGKVRSNADSHPRTSEQVAAAV